MPAAYLTPAVFLMAAAVSALLTFAWIGLARRTNLLDQPGARRVHSRATPRGGGLGIALLGAAAWIWSFDSDTLNPVNWHLGVGILLFALVGLADDLRPLAAGPKLLGQLLAAGVLCTGTNDVSGLALALLVLAAAYWVNVVNFMDGSNGLVGLQGLVISLALAAWPGQPIEIVFAALVLAGACAGFLPFNLGLARVFLGDIGSHAIGAGLFALFLASWRSGVLPLACVLILATPILLDSGLTLARRVIAGRKPWRAHREHLYQYAIRSRIPHLNVALAYAAWTLASSLLAATALNLRSNLVMWALLILNGGLGMAAYCGLRRRWLSSRERRKSVNE